MVNALYNELSAYYNHVVHVDNSVKRVAELMLCLNSVTVSDPFDDLLQYL
jgi:hypothetical protein